MEQLWGSRFSKKIDSKVNDFNSSLPFDYKLYKHDIMGSIAHSTMLSKQGILTQEEKDKIVKALNEILESIENGEITFDKDFEDIHTYIEKLLIEKVGEIGKKVHTGRSRNDQVALDVRLYEREQISNVKTLLLDLIETLLNLSQEHSETIMPGYTHLQRAQAITFGHHLGAYTEMFKRDYERLTDIYKRTNVLPLGSGALAGSPHNLDRFETAKLLNFDEVCYNSIDGVSDRDFIIEFLNALSLIMMHLSRLSEELILWSSYEFKFIDLDDAYATGSSIMPQKKNPDVPELIRGKTGRVYGCLMALLTTMKSLPLAYNKDMQEDKEQLFDATENVILCLEIVPPLLKTMTVNKDKMLKAVKDGFLNATDVADYLVKKGLPFRDAHEVSGKLVAKCIKENKTLEDLSLEDYKFESNLFENDIFETITPTNSVNAKKTFGGTSFEAVKKTIELNKQWLNSKK